MKKENRILDFIGAWLGVFDVDWNRGFDDDGYTDFLGIDPLNEPIFYGNTAYVPQPQPNTIDIKTATHRAQ